MTQALIGTIQVGLVCVRGCLQRVDESGLEDRETIIDLMIEEL